MPRFPKTSKISYRYRSRGWLAARQKACSTETHFPEEALESRVRTKRVEYWVHLEASDPGIPLLVGFLKPCQSLVLLAQAGKDDGHGRGGHVVLPRALHQFFDDLERLRPTAGGGIGVSKRPQLPRAASREFHGLLQFGNRLVVSSLL